MKEVEEAIIGLGCIVNQENADEIREAIRLLSAYRIMLRDLEEVE